MKALPGAKINLRTKIVSHYVVGDEVLNRGWPVYWRDKPRKSILTVLNNVLLVML